MSELATDFTRFELVGATPLDLEEMPQPLLKGVSEGFKSADEATEELRSVIAQFERVPRPPEWGEFWSHDVSGGRYVGLVGFKSMPRDGEVEIAYFTFPRFQRQGFATAAIRQLVARSSEAVKQVIAHTLRSEGPSTSALKRCGFTLSAEVVDVDDGPVWRWAAGVP